MRKLVMLAVCAALIGCTKVGTQTAGPEGGRHAYTHPHELRYATAEDITGLNPHLATQTVVSYLTQLTMAYLLRTGPHNEPVPELAVAVPSKANGGISPDGKAITYHLRKGVVWSDGAPFNADDVVFSTNVVLNPANNEISRTGWDHITKIDEPDKYTVVYHLKKPYASYAYTYFSTAGANPCLLPKHLLAKYPNINNIAYNSLPIGIGPFKYVQWKRSDFVELVANPSYFRGKPKLNRIIFKIIPDRNTVLTELQSHEIDLWSPVAANYYDRIKALPGITLLKHPGYYFGHIDFNVGHPVLKDVAVRQALRYAIDRQTIKEKIRHGLGIVQDDMVSPANPAFDPKVPTTPFDIVKANALLDGDGWKRGPDGVRRKGSLRLSLVFATSTGTPDTDQEIELIRGWWKQIGAEIDVKRYPSPLFFGPYSQGGILYAGKFDLATFQWSGDPQGDLSNLYECNQFPPNGQNVVRYCNATVDAAMEKFKTLYEFKERQPYADFIQTQLQKDAPTIVTSISDDIFAYNSDLKGFNPNQLGPFDDFMHVDI
ncbi:MAG: peptide ABC transporter substrate-binding protein [Candidatus Baltobacteraceae bacterium]